MLGGLEQLGTWHCPLSVSRDGPSKLQGVQRGKGPLPLGQMQSEECPRKTEDIFLDNYWFLQALPHSQPYDEEAKGISHFFLLKAYLRMRSARCACKV